MTAVEMTAVGVLVRQVNAQVLQCEQSVHVYSLQLGQQVTDIVCEERAGRMGGKTRVPGRGPVL